MGSTVSRVELDVSSVDLLKKHVMGFGTLLLLARPTTIPIEDAYWMDLLVAVRLPCERQLSFEVLVSALVECVISPLIRYNHCTNNCITLLRIHSKLMKTFRISLVNSQLPFSGRSLVHLTVLTKLVVENFFRKSQWMDIACAFSSRCEREQRESESGRTPVMIYFSKHRPIPLSFPISIDGAFVDPTEGILEAIISEINKLDPKEVHKIHKNNLFVQVISSPTKEIFEIASLSQYIEKWITLNRDDIRSGNIPTIELFVVPKTLSYGSSFLTDYILECVMMFINLNEVDVQPPLQRHVSAISALVIIIGTMIKDFFTYGPPTRPLLQSSIEAVYYRDQESNSQLSVSLIKQLISRSVPYTAEIDHSSRIVLDIPPVLDSSTNDMLPEPDAQIAANRANLMENLYNDDVSSTSVMLDTCSVYRSPLQVLGFPETVREIFLLLITHCPAPPPLTQSVFINPFVQAFDDSLVLRQCEVLSALLGKTDHPLVVEVVMILLVKWKLTPDDIVDLSVPFDSLLSVISHSDSRIKAIALGIVVKMSNCQRWWKGLSQVSALQPSWVTYKIDQATFLILSLIRIISLTIKDAGKDPDNTIHVYIVHLCSSILFNSCSHYEYFFNVFTSELMPKWTKGICTRLIDIIPLEESERNNLTKGVRREMSSSLLALRTILVLFTHLVSSEHKESPRLTYNCLRFIVDPLDRLRKHLLQAKWDRDILVQQTVFVEGLRGYLEHDSPSLGILCGVLKLIPVIEIIISFQHAMPNNEDVYENAEEDLKENVKNIVSSVEESVKRVCTPITFTISEDLLSFHTRKMCSLLYPTHLG